MKLQKVICIEDSTIKYMDIYRFLQRERIPVVYHVSDAETAIKEIEKAINDGTPYDLLLSDMHFIFFGNDDRSAGEKTMKLLREKGIDIPVIFCSSQNWKIPGAVGNVFYNPHRDWEQDAAELFATIRGM